MAVRETVVYEVKVQGAPQVVADNKAVSRSFDDLRRSQQQAATVGAKGGGWAGTEAEWAAMNARGRAAARAGGSGAAAAAAAAGGIGARQQVGRGAGLLGLASTGPIAAGAIGYAALRQFTAGVRHFGEVQQLNAQTAAGIKSTGGAANVTAKHIRDLASQYQRLDGIQDESVQQSENVLLAFTHIRNEAGKGNRVFDLTTQAVANVAARMGTDMPTAAAQLGRAINNPIQGISTLRSLNVQLSNSQVEQIKVMTAQGDRLGAQKIILGQLTRAFGGSAAAAGKTLPAALSRLQDSWEDSRNKLVKRLMPAATSFTNWLALTLPGAIDQGLTAMSVLDTDPRSNAVSRWLHRNWGGDKSGGTFDYLLQNSGVDIGKDAVGALPSWMRPGLDTKGGIFGIPGTDRSQPSTATKDAQGLAERQRQRAAAAGAYRGLGSPFPERQVKVNWNPGDPFDTRPVVLVANGVEIAKVVTKGQQKRAHAEGRGSGHK